MSDEERAIEVIRVARGVLRRVLGDGRLILYMVAHDVAPDDIEGVVAEIMAYLDITEEEEKPHG